MWEQVSLCLPTHLPSYLPLPSLYTSSVIPGWRQLADIALDGAGASTWVSQWWVLVVDVCSGKSWGTGRDDHSGAGGCILVIAEGWRHDGECTMCSCLVLRSERG